MTNFCDGHHINLFYLIYHFVLLLLLVDIYLQGPVFDISISKLFFYVIYHRALRFPKLGTCLREIMNALTRLRITG